MKRLILLILIIVLKVFDTYCQNVENDKLWIGSYRINNYQADSVMHSDTTKFLSSVLWFSENKINIVSFVINYEKCSTLLDTMIFEYRIDGGNIIGNIKNDTVLTGVLDKNRLRINIGEANSNVNVTFLNPSTKKIKNIKDEKIISDFLINGRWETLIKGDTIYEEFLSDNKFKLSTWDRNQRWDIFKILDCYFLVTNDCFYKLHLRLIKNASSKEMNILVFRNEEIEKYTMRNSK
ncbi:MAG: hypothetical protein U9R42_09045 [Bacteroidota bacterium]|nr:hypothetical protein [Bacteroidota bacterium]